MKKLYIVSLILLTFFHFDSFAQQVSRRTCGTVEVTERIKRNDPGMASRMQQIEEHTANFVATRRPGQINAPIVTIPVVFHVVYNTTAQNISDALINAQLEQLNLDYAKLNTDVGNAPVDFQGRVGTPNIQFCLAQRDPNGLTTSGIIRKQTNVVSFSTNDNDKVKFTAQGGDNAWDRTKYLNIWVCNLSNNILGYAIPPGGPAANDGVVLLYSTVGSMLRPGSGAPVNLGRTATHEVGHWLNLRHIWGDANCGDDQVNDTPLHKEANYGCPAYPTRSTCTGSPIMMTMNYMDYTDDRCMYMFTNGQVARMQAMFSAGGARASLLTSDRCNSATFSFNSVSPVSITCKSSSSSPVSLGTTATSGFNTPINLTATGNPNGTTVSFSVNTITPGNSVNVTLNNTETLQAGSYTVTVKGTAGSAIQTIPIIFNITRVPPGITSEPNDSSICDGLNASFTTGTSAIGATIQWQRSVNGGTTWTNLPGATNASYSITNAGSSMNNYRYRAIISTQCGNDTTRAAKLTIKSNLRIVSEPSNVEVGISRNATFSVIATGSGITYQWQDSVDINGWRNMVDSTSSSIRIANTAYTDSGKKYRVIMNSDCGPKDTSRAAMLIVVKGNFNIQAATSINVSCGTDLVPLTINTIEKRTFNALSNQITLSYNANNSGTQAQFSSQNIIAGSSSIVTLINTDSLKPGAPYPVTITGTANGPDGIIVKSVTININVTPRNPDPLTEEEQPDSVNAVIGENVTFSTSYINNNIISYQWQESTKTAPDNWQNILGANSSTYVKSNVDLTSNGNNYRVIITNNCGALISRAALLRFPPFQINPNPNNGSFDIFLDIVTNSGISQRVGSVAIYDNRGAKVYERVINDPATRKIHCDTRNLPYGIYRVLIRDQKGGKIQETPVLIYSN